MKHNVNIILLLLLSIITPNISANNNIDNYEFLENLLKKEYYAAFFTSVSKMELEPKEYKSFLINHQDSGHIPIYWLLSEMYARENKTIEAQKWLYIASIATRQDSEICIDKTSIKSTQILFNHFKFSVEIAQRNTDKNNEIIPHVIFFIQNIKTRSHPSWACVYGDYYETVKNDPVIEQQYWKSNRNKTLNKFMSEQGISN